MWVINNCMLTLSSHRLTLQLPDVLFQAPLSKLKVRRCLRFMSSVAVRAGGSRATCSSNEMCDSKGERWHPYFLSHQVSTLMPSVFHLVSPFTSRYVLEKCKPKSAATLLTFQSKISWRNRGRLICWELSTVCSTVSVPYFHPIPAKGSYRWAYA